MSKIEDIIGLGAILLGLLFIVYIRIEMNKNDLQEIDKAKKICSLNNLTYIDVPSMGGKFCAILDSKIIVEKYRIKFKGEDDYVLIEE